jgi:hypothetical protein
MISNNPNMHESSPREKRERRENIQREIMAENFPNLVKNTNHRSNNSSEYQTR